MDQAGIQNLVMYKKEVLRDDRRESRIRGSIEATLGYFSNSNSGRNSLNNGPFPNDTITDPKPAGSASPLQLPRAAYGANNITDPYSRDGSQTDVESRPMSYDKKGAFFPNEKNPFNDTHMIDDKKDVAHATKDVHHGHHDEPFVGELTWKQRLKHFTFAWFACTMSTGGIATVLSVIPNASTVILDMGTVIFVINIGLFLTFATLMVTRFVIYPGTLKKALANPHEGFFFATFWLSLATMINNATAYGIPKTGPWLITALRIAFWTYTVCVTILAIGYYHVLFTVKKLVITNVLPGWVLPIFPAMLVGTIASTIAKTQPPQYAMPMLTAGLTYQGLGMMVAVMMFGLYFGRLLTSGLPIDMSRPAMFIAVGPPSFTALAFIGMAQDVVTLNVFATHQVLPGIANPSLIPDFFQILALLIAVFLWMLAFWFFGIAVIASIEAITRNNFHLNWYAYVFPNVGFTIATIKIGERLGSEAVQLVGTGMAAVFFFLWLLIVFCHIKAVHRKEIMWPGKDEDAH